MMLVQQGSALRQDYLCIQCTGMWCIHICNRMACAGMGCFGTGLITQGWSVVDCSASVLWIKTTPRKLVVQEIQECSAFGWGCLYINRVVLDQE